MITIKIAMGTHRRDISFYINKLKNVLRNEAILEEYSLHRFFLSKKEKHKAKSRLKGRLKTKYSQKTNGSYNVR